MSEQAQPSGGDEVAKTEALRHALIEGEASGIPRHFDSKAFLKRMKCQLNGS